MVAVDCSGEFLAESLGFLCLLFFLEGPSAALGDCGALSKIRGDDWSW
jgi:hypothetical protein